MSLIRKIKNLGNACWALGFVRGGLNAVMESDHVVVDWVKMPKDRWFADPFVLDVTENEILLLVEDYGYDTRKGIIALLHIDRRTMEINSRKVLLELPTHLSFPAIWRKEGHIYIYPESAQSGRLDMYEFFPETETLTFVQTICDDVVWDSYITEAFGNSLLFTAAHNDNQLDIYRWNADKSRYVPYQAIPSEKPNSRLGGAVFEYKGRYYYPAQDCTRNYGGGIDIKKIEYVREKIVVQETMKHLESPSARFPLGLHTLNAYKGVAVIDVKGYRFGRIGAIMDKLVSLKKRMKNAAK